MISVRKITTIFYIIDDFYKEFKPIVEKYSLKTNSKKKIRSRKSKFSESAVMSILICFHFSGVRNLKYFYLNKTILMTENH